MQPNKIIKLVSLVTALLILFSGISFAQNIKQRMKARLPVILDLKRKGIIGEDNRGYLGFVGSKRTHAALISQENKDRKTIYMQIAKQHKTQLAVVERQRAAQLARQAAKGTYIMNAQKKKEKK